MGKAARAIIIQDNTLLVMLRNKNGSEYFTLVGGRVKDDETIGQALTREVKEETGLDVIAGRMVFVEEHPAPHDEQYIFLCQVAPHGEIAIQESSEEAYMNKIDIDIHTPMWVGIKAFSELAFRTSQLQTAIVEGLKNGFPEQPVRL